MSSARRTQRSRDNRIFAGVCGGLDESHGVSATALRIVFLIATLASGTGAIAYLLFWAFMPLAPKPEAGSFERSLDKATSHIRVGKKLIGVISGMASLFIAASQEIDKHLPDTKAAAASDTVAVPAQYDASLMNMLEQSTSTPPARAQPKRAISKPEPQAPVVQVSDEELLEVIEASNNAQIEAARGGDRERLHDFFVGEALAKQLEYLESLRALNVKEYATLLGSNVSWIEKDGTNARVRVVERWRSELRGADGSCATKPDHEVPQTIHLQRRGATWKVSAISFESVTDAEFQPCF